MTFVAAIEYLASHENVVPGDFDKAAGVGVQVGVEEIQKYFDSLFIERKDWISKERYKTLAQLLKSARDDERLKWADGKALKMVLDSKLETTLGPKDERDIPVKKVSLSVLFPF